MGKISILLVTIVLSYSAGISNAKLRLSGNNTNEAEAKEFLRRYNDDTAKLSNKYVIADWNYNTNLTEANANESLAWSAQLTAFNAKAFEEASQFDPTNFSADIQRQLSKVGSMSLSEAEMEDLASTISKMGEIYGSFKVCRPTNASDCLALEPELTELLASENTSLADREWAWNGWHNGLGEQLRPMYSSYKRLKNLLAQKNNYTDYGQELRDRYDDVNFETPIKVLYDRMLPLYKQLHAYIRMKINQHYKTNYTDTIPQHVLGDMWGRFWINLYPIAVPYPNKPSLDVTDNMKAQNYTVRRMYDTANEFYKSLGLLPLPNTFFNLSMLEKPADREVICHATAWDFYDGKDYRIKMCTNINFEDFLTVHHEMGHIQYFMQSSVQPSIYRDGANDGFHEAVGELMSMCVSTPKHLYAIGLLDDLLQDNETEINYLFSKALATVSTLPFHFLNDKWRWDVFAFNSTIKEVDWNTHFWDLSEELVGVTPPGSRPDNVLDPPTIFHVAQDYDMIRYFTRTILQFQFAEALCQAAGHTGPLHECDFYGSVAAGDKLASMLKLGSSKPWPEALEVITGQKTMNADAIVKYFEPLRLWLEQENYKNNNKVGWTVSRSSSQSESKSAVDEEKASVANNTVVPEPQPQPQQEKQQQQQPEQQERRGAENVAELFQQQQQKKSQDKPQPVKTPQVTPEISAVPKPVEVVKAEPSNPAPAPVAEKTESEQPKSDVKSEEIKKESQPNATVVKSENQEPNASSTVDVQENKGQRTVESPEVVNASKSNSNSNSVIPAPTNETEAKDQPAVEVSTAAPATTKVEKVTANHHAATTAPPRTKRHVETHKLITHPHSPLVKTTHHSKRFVKQQHRSGAA